MFGQTSKNNTMSIRPTLLVTGASGQLGRLTVQFLLESGYDNVIAGSRDTTKLAEFAAKGAEIRTVDFDAPETLTAAFKGVDRLLLVSSDALFVPGQRLTQHRAAIQAAVEAGVKHILYTSVTRADSASLIKATPDHYATEQAIIASGLNYTFLRNTLYADNILNSLPQILSTGKWFHATGTGKISYATREDCARVAAAALASDSGENQVIEITGPEALDNKELAAILQEISGKPVEAIAIDHDSLVSALLQAGIPEVFSNLLADFDTAQEKGDFDILSPAIRELTGREPQTVREFFTGRI